MKLLTASALLCAMMALTAAEDECYVLKKSSSCPCDWTEYNDQCYLYVSTPLAWGDAQKNCQSMSANLASVQSLEEYQLIQRLISSGGRTWIGGSDGQKEGYWFWIDGTPLKYTNWCQKEPNNMGGNEQCMEMNFSGDKCMNDQNCQDQFPSVCIKRK
ncbi:ladderlectin-like [Oreochromis aureus]|uniref:C-type lectin domain-containing protein n=1 Tax=Oreochromis aureus TaxID=47969 RepID=A0A668TX57_OREAU|nr:ladderlectin-like [Oreochromis aureus]